MRAHGHAQRGGSLSVSPPNESGSSADGSSRSASLNAFGVLNRNSLDGNADLSTPAPAVHGNVAPQQVVPSRQQHGSMSGTHAHGGPTAMQQHDTAPSAQHQQLPAIPKPASRPQQLLNRLKLTRKVPGSAASLGATVHRPGPAVPVAHSFSVSGAQPTGSFPGGGSVPGGGAASGSAGFSIGPYGDGSDVEEFSPGASHPTNPLAALVTPFRMMRPLVPAVASRATAAAVAGVKRSIVRRTQQLVPKAATKLDNVPPMGYVWLWMGNFRRWQRRFLVASEAPGVALIYKRMNMKGKVWSISLRNASVQYDDADPRQLKILTPTGQIFLRTAMPEERQQWLECLRQSIDLFNKNQSVVETLKDQGLLPKEGEDLGTGSMGLGAGIHLPEVAELDAQQRRRIRTLVSERLFEIVPFQQEVERHMSLLSTQLLGVVSGLNIRLPAMTPSNSMLRMSSFAQMRGQAAAGPVPDQAGWPADAPSAGAAQYDTAPTAFVAPPPPPPPAAATTTLGSSPPGSTSGTGPSAAVPIPPRSSALASALRAGGEQQQQQHAAQPTAKVEAAHVAAAASGAAHISSPGPSGMPAQGASETGYGSGAVGGASGGPYSAIGTRLRASRGAPRSPNLQQAYGQLLEAVRYGLHAEAVRIAQLEAENLALQRTANIFKAKLAAAIGNGSPMRRVRSEAGTGTGLPGASFGSGTAVSAAGAAAAAVAAGGGAAAVGPASRRGTGSRQPSAAAPAAAGAAAAGAGSVGSAGGAAADGVTGPTDERDDASVITADEDAFDVTEAFDEDVDYDILDEADDAPYDEIYPSAITAPASAARAKADGAAGATAAGADGGVGPCRMMSLGDEDEESEDEEEGDSEAEEAHVLNALEVVRQVEYVEKLHAAEHFTQAIATQEPPTGDMPPEAYEEEEEEEEEVDEQQDTDTPLEGDGDRPTGASGKKLRPVRTQLPAPKPLGKGFSIWTILKNMIGKDLTRITMPATINEPTSTLQRLAESVEYAALLDKAVITPDSVDRMMLVAIWNLSVYNSQALRDGKPFNPLLGETYEWQSLDGNTRYVCEQVSHHPPVLAYVADGSAGAWKLQGELETKSKFWGKSIELNLVGTEGLVLTVPPAGSTPAASAAAVGAASSPTAGNGPSGSGAGQQQQAAGAASTAGQQGATSGSGSGAGGIASRASSEPLPATQTGGVSEEYRFNRATICVHDVILGNFWIEVYGKVKILNTATGDYAILNLKPCRGRKAERGRCEGVVYNAAGQEVWHISGSSMDKLYAQLSPAAAKARGLSTPPEPALMWEKVPYSEDAAMQYWFTKFAIGMNDPGDPLVSWLPPTDTRFRPDQRALELGEYNKATAEKLRLEEKQRQVRRQRANAGVEYRPMWFNQADPQQLVRLPDQDGFAWVFTGEYWRRRERRDWSCCPDIYSHAPGDIGSFATNAEALARPRTP